MSENASTPEIWLYRRGGDWSRIPDFRASRDGELDSDTMRTAGYDQQELHYGSEDSFMVEVHARSGHGKRPPYDYFVWVSIGSHCEPVALPTLPDLLSLLADLAPLSRPRVTAAIPAAGGWVAGGLPVAAFAMDYEGNISPMVEPPPRHDGKPDLRGHLAESFGLIRGPRR